MRALSKPKNKDVAGVAGGSTEASAGNRVCEGDVDEVSEREEEGDDDKFEVPDLDSGEGFETCVGIAADVDEACLDGTDSPGVSSLCSICALASSVGASKVKDENSLSRSETFEDAPGMVQTPTRSRKELAVSYVSSSGVRRRLYSAPNAKSDSKENTFKSNRVHNSKSSSIRAV